ncbi:hypothetical protein ANCCAN_20309 [Ancylostoma caninum]|uniref:RRM domain-containing protein n=1 Tax=Ancylostoma caninum TaxID=29170 RepID=A0A368FNV8_ANCCA|nr:hypothetical protein ANCCAN_20309 [Ancylostoma caninum]
MLRRPLTSIEIKADDIDHMEKVLLDLYHKKAMDRYGYQKRNTKPQGNRKVFKDEQDDDVVEVEDAAEKKDRATNGQTPSGKRKRDYHKDAKLKSWRMIIRNLPFKTKKEDLQNVCSKFGTFTDIVLPPSKKMPGRIAGFAFVQFKTREAAEKAREHFNSNKFQGRLVAADWALPKDTYETAAEEEREQLKKKVKLEKDDDVKDVKKEETDQSSAKAPQQSSASHSRGHSEDDDEDEEMSDEEVDEDDKSEGGGSEGEVSGDEDEKGDDDESESEADEPTRKDTAIDEQRVVFLRNLSFDTTNETLKTEMEKFGTVKLALCCKFRDSGHPKGTAFVHFSSAEEAQACIQATEEGLEIEIEKRKSVKVPEDKRNLRLLRFGLIREGTSAAKGMSSEDAAKRQRLAEVSRKKLENLHMFVSPTRLMIHNLPLTMTDETLKQICRNATGSAGMITECRIWKDTSKVDAKGNPRSKGFAFVNFAEHKDALACLQKLNNNPSTFTNERRPIVEFSIENLLAIRAKARRAANSKGEKLTGRELSEKVRQQVKQSIGEVHASGMKAMPKFLGKKLRHKNMSKTQLKKKNIGKKREKRKQESLASDVAAKKPKGKNKKHMTKYLALSA